MDRSSPRKRILSVHREAAAMMRLPYMRWHLIGATVVWMTLWGGLLYGAECVFAAVPWVRISRAAPTLFDALNLAFYVLDGLITLFLILPLTYGYARILCAAAKAERAPLRTLFCAFEDGRAYRRALRRSLAIAAPRALAVAVLLYLLAQATAAEQTLAAVLWTLALAVLGVLLSLLLCLDAALPALWQTSGHGAKDQKPLRSRTLCRRRLGELWLFKLSFIGWGMLSLASFGIVALLHALPLYAIAGIRISFSLLPSESSSECSNIC